MPILVALYNLLPIIDRKILILTSILHAHIKFIEFLGSITDGNLKQIFTFKLLYDELIKYVRKSWWCSHWIDTLVYKFHNVKMKKDFGKIYQTHIVTKNESQNELCLECFTTFNTPYLPFLFNARAMKN